MFYYLGQADSDLGEAYLLNEPQPHLLSIIGIGIVVILTGYLFLDAP